MNFKQTLILCLLGISSMLSAQNKILTNSRHISSADGLPSNQIFDMTQDADGYIWMAAANGLCRYDGYHFYNIYNLGPESDPIHGVVGYVFPDDDKRHLWMRTSTYVYCCYDLHAGCFIDFTNKGDHARTYRRFIRGKQGVVWMFDDESGVRRVKGNTDGPVNCTDYTKTNGGLPINHVNDAFEDTQARLWAMTSSGITIIDAQGKARTIAKGIFFRRGIQIGKQMLALTNTGLVYAFDENGRELRLIPIAADVNNIKMVTASFQWHG